MAGLDAFVVHLRHELRNPVNAIVGYSQLLIEEAGGGPLSESGRRGLAQIEAAGHQLSQIVGQILDPAAAPGCTISDYAVRLRHAVRTPVTSVQGYAETILDEVEGGAMAEDLRRIHSAAATLLELTDAVERLYLLRDGSASGEPGESGPTTAEIAQTLAM